MKIEFNKLREVCCNRSDKFCNHPSFEGRMMYCEIEKCPLKSEIDNEEPPELLQCPFCGGTATIDTDDHLQQVRCTGCQIGTEWTKFVSRAITEWNTRVPLSTCKECNKELQNAEATINELERTLNMSERNLNDARKKIEELEAEVERYKTAMDALWKLHNDEMKKAYEAGADSITLDGFDNLKQESTYEQWKKKQK